MNERFNRFLGGNPLSVLARLVFLSLIVGIVMAALGLHPFDLVYGLQSLVTDLWDRGAEIIGRLGNYLVLGAVVVIPLWLLSRIFGNMKGR